MPPTDYRRRRRRGRLSRLGVVVVTVAIVVVLGIVVLVGAISKVGRESGPYWRDIDRSYAADLRGVVRQSNDADAQFRSVVAGMAGDTRTRLEASLDTLVTTTKQLAQEAATLSTPPPAQGAGADIARAMTDRATAVAELRTTVNGLLGMAPLPDPGASASTASPGTALLSASAAADRLESVSALLEDADRLYGAGRRALSQAPGHARLPVSVWLRRTAAWTSGGVQAVVRELVDSSSLAVVHDVVLLPHGLVLTPAAVPPAQGSSTSGTLHLPPTKWLSLTAVVADKGNVTARGVVVDESMQPAAGGASIERAARVSVAADAAASVSLPKLRVDPATTYTVTVRVVSTSASSSAADTTDTMTISIAPPAPATVLELMPSSGRPRGGTSVTILGAGFTSVSAVDFGKARARFIVVSKSQITATAPPGTGTVTVTVVNPGGTSPSSSASRFTYKVPRHKRSS